MRAVTYLRVSSEQQGKSGLGIEAQRRAIERFIAEHGYEVAAEFVEVETGKGSDALERRPQLAAALKKAKSDKCPVIVAKLDRLSHDVARDRSRPDRPAGADASGRRMDRYGREAGARPAGAGRGKLRGRRP